MHLRKLEYFEFQILKCLLPWINLAQTSILKPSVACLCAGLVLVVIYVDRTVSSRPNCKQVIDISYQSIYSSVNDKTSLLLLAYNDVDVVCLV